MPGRPGLPGLPARAGPCPGRTSWSTGRGDHHGQRGGGRARPGPSWWAPSPASMDTSGPQSRQEAGRPAAPAWKSASQRTRRSRLGPGRGAGPHARVGGGTGRRPGMKTVATGCSPALFTQRTLCRLRRHSTRDRHQAVCGRNRWPGRTPASPPHARGPPRSRAEHQLLPGRARLPPARHRAIGIVNVLGFLMFRVKKRVPQLPSG